ncbi:MAG: hypothetical protein AB7G75_31100 [Candidatus Binatia bacterium]
MNASQLAARFFTYDDILTNFPSALPFDLGFERDSAIYELPITFDEGQSSTLAERLGATFAVIHASADTGARSLMVVPTDNPRRDVPTEESLLRGLPKEIPAIDIASFARS